jgi:hypothetical protein
MAIMKLKTLPMLAAALLVVTACDTIDDILEGEEDRIPGERIPVRAQLCGGPALDASLLMKQPGSAMPSGASSSSRCCVAQTARATHSRRSRAGALPGGATSSTTRQLSRSATAVKC